MPYFFTFLALFCFVQLVFMYLQSNSWDSSNKVKNFKLFWFIFKNVEAELGRKLRRFWALNSGYFKKFKPDSKIEPSCIKKECIFNTKRINFIRITQATSTERTRTIRIILLLEFLKDVSPKYVALNKIKSMSSCVQATDQQVQAELIRIFCDV